MGVSQQETVQLSERRWVAGVDAHLSSLLGNIRGRVMPGKMSVASDRPLASYE